MKRKTVYRLKLDRVANTYRVEAARGYVDNYVHGKYHFTVCYMVYGHGWMSAVGGVMCTTGKTLAACKERTTAGLTDMIARGRLPQLLAVQMALNDVLQNGCSIACRKYDDLCKQYREIAEGMLDA